MKYKGIELEEITEPQIFNPPKKMLVWDRDNDIPTECYVYAIVDRGADSFPVICKYSTWKHCAGIPESKLVTYRELARWLAEGNGESSDGNTCYPNWNYHRIQGNDSVSKTILVRKWDDTEWHKPTREYLGLNNK